MDEEWGLTTRRFKVMGEMVAVELSGRDEVRANQRDSTECLRREGVHKIQVRYPQIVGNAKPAAVDRAGS